MSMAIKKCLGLNRCLSQQKMYAWLYELTPNERAELYLLRNLKKLIDFGHKIENMDYYVNTLSNCSENEAKEYLEGNKKLKDLRIAMLGNKSKKEGLSNGKPFETLCTKDLDWFKFSTKEIDMYRWKNAICYFCKGK